MKINQSMTMMATDHKRYIKSLIILSFVRATSYFYFIRLIFCYFTESRWKVLWKFTLFNSLFSVFMVRFLFLYNLLFVFLTYFTAWTEITSRSKIYEGWVPSSIKKAQIGPFLLFQQNVPSWLLTIDPIVLD